MRPASIKSDALMLSAVQAGSKRFPLFSSARVPKGDLIELQGFARNLCSEFSRQKMQIRVFPNSIEKSLNNPSFALR